MSLASSFTHLRSLTGSKWTGRNSLWFEPGTSAIESATSASITTVVGGKIATFDYSWSHEGEPHDGRVLLSVDDAEGVHMAWCDPFHMDARIMDLAGDGGGEVIAASGSYQIADSEPWGWRIELEPQGTDGLQMRMFNILPSSMGGLEALAVRADYTRD